MINQTFTLAAVCQAARLVQLISRGGKINDDEFTMLLNSILITSPENTLDVYGGNTDLLTTGLTILLAQLSNQTKVKDAELTRYLVSLLALERKLSRNKALLAKLGSRIEQAKRQTEHYDITSETLLASLASIYSDLISPLGTPIQVMGEPEILKNTLNQHKIRALLLAGIRSAVLWRQVGGKRRYIIFARSKMVECAKTLLK